VVVFVLVTVLVTVVAVVVVGDVTPVRMRRFGGHESSLTG
jgi:hypothetical protein